MRHVLLWIILLLTASVTCAQSPLQKGDWLLGGNARLGYHSDAGFRLSVAPRGIYMAGDRVGLGLRAEGFWQIRRSSQFNVGLSPFLRTYLHGPEARWLPFLQIGMGYRLGGGSAFGGFGSNLWSMLSVSGGVGVNHFLTEHLALELYSQLIYEGTLPNDVIEREYWDLSLRAGLLFLIPGQSNRSQR